VEGIILGHVCGVMLHWEVVTCADMLCGSVTVCGVMLHWEVVTCADMLCGSVTVVLMLRWEIVPCADMLYNRVTQHDTSSHTVDT
jgi:hypothetical protein